MIEPLIRRTNEEAIRKQYSTIKTTPESIVKIYRLQEARCDPEKESLTDRGHFMGPYIYSPRRPRIPWHQKVNWNVASKMVSFVCAVAVALVMIYLAVVHVIPFVETLRWG